MPVWKVMQVYWVLRIIRWVWRAVAEGRVERWRQREIDRVVKARAERKRSRELQRLFVEFWESEVDRLSEGVGGGE